MSPNDNQSPTPEGDSPQSIFDHIDTLDADARAADFEGLTALTNIKPEPAAGSDGASFGDHSYDQLSASADYRASDED